MQQAWSFREQGRRPRPWEQSVGWAECQVPIQNSFFEELHGISYFLIFAFRSLHLKKLNWSVTYLITLNEHEYVLCPVNVMLTVSSCIPPKNSLYRQLPENFSLDFTFAWFPLNIYHWKFTHLKLSYLKLDIIWSLKSVCYNRPFSVISLLFITEQEVLLFYFNVFSFSSLFYLIII